MLGATYLTITATLFKRSNSDSTPHFQYFTMKDTQYEPMSSVLQEGSTFEWSLFAFIRIFSLSLGKEVAMLCQQDVYSLKSRAILGKRWSVDDKIIWSDVTCRGYEYWCILHHTSGKIFVDPLNLRTMGITRVNYLHFNKSESSETRSKVFPTAADGAPALFEGLW